MKIVGAILSILGLACDAIAGLVLLPRIFVTDKELNFLAELPIEQSTTHMTGAISQANMPVAVTDVEKLNDYRKQYIGARKEERKNGQIGLWLLVVGAVLQVAGVLLTVV